MIEDSVSHLTINDHGNADFLLEPEMYPDPAIFRNSLARITQDELELKKNLMKNLSKIQVLAPYLKTVYKNQRRIFQTAVKRKPERSQFPQYTIKVPHTTIFPDLSTKSEMLVSIHETSDVLKALLEVNNVVCYLVNITEDKLYQLPRHVTSLMTNLTWKIESGTTIAAYAAFYKNYVISKQISTDKRFPLGLGYLTKTLQHAMCVPIKSPDNRILGVFELTKTVDQEAFTGKDIQTVLAVAGWMGVAIFQNSLYTSLVRQHELTNYLLQLTDHYHSGHADYERTLSEVAVFARDTVNAERCCLFIIDKERNSSFVVDEYEQGAEKNARTLYKRRLQKTVMRDTSILSRVLFDRETITCHSGTSDDGVVTDPFLRSVLCAPILSCEKVIGAIQLMNKRVLMKFNENDKETLERFTKFCSVNINHLRSQDKTKNVKLKLNMNQELLIHHIKPCVRDEEQVSNSLKKNKALPEDFFTFSWYPAIDDMPKLTEITINVFNHILGNSFMQVNDVPRFVLTVQKCYRSNSYHNFTHAVSVTHAMANILKHHHRLFTGIERKGLMIASLCHDLDHRGYNNNFIQLTKHYLSSLYETSCLENHHFAVTKMVMEECGLCKYLKPDIYNELLNEMYELIIATDLSLYFQSRMELIKSVDERSFTFHDQSHRRLIKSLMITTCDLFGQTKPFLISKQITEDVYEEFFQQGDIEKKMGVVPLPMMDRDAVHMIPENQVCFLTIVVIPCVELVSRFFSSLSPVVQATKIVLQQWREIIKVKDQATWKPEESYVRQKDTEKND